METIPSGNAAKRSEGETKGEPELTLVRLRRLSKTVMSKNDRYRLEARKFCRSNIVTFLERHLAHPSEKVRYLSLELLCGTIPRLATKTDCLLRPILPRVFQCLKETEGRELKLKALHFLRGYFTNTKSPSSFIDNFVRLGIENADEGVQFTCCLGLNIVFDRNIGSSLYSPLFAAVCNLLLRYRSRHRLFRAAFRAVIHFQETIGADRFFDLLEPAHLEAREVYKNMYNFEEPVPLVACDEVLVEYRNKRRNQNLAKDFGILDPCILDRICQTKNCERARVIERLVADLRRIPWTSDELDPHILDILRVIQSFVLDSNRLVQLSGLDAMKEIASRMGFTLSPHLRLIVDTLRPLLTSANSKVRSRLDRVLGRLMRNIHPMPILWGMLRTEDASMKEAVMTLVQEKLGTIPYYDLDMVPLCDHLAQHLEDHRHPELARNSRDCVILLLDTMRESPVQGLRTEAVRILLKNHRFGRETLRDIGVLGNDEDDEDDSRSFDSYPDDEIADLDSTTPMESTATNISLTDTPRTLSSAKAYSDVSLRKSKSCRTICEETYVVGPPTLESYKASEELDTISERGSTTPENYEGNFDVKLSANEISGSSIVECEDMCSIQEYSLSRSEADSLPSATQYLEQGDLPHKVLLAESDFCLESPKTNTHGSSNVIELQQVVHEPDPSKKSRKYWTRFSLRTDPEPSDLRDVDAGGEDPEAFLRTRGADPGVDLKKISRFIIESYEQDGVHVDVMNKDIFNFNILQVDHSEIEDSTERLETAEDKVRNTKTTSNKTRTVILQTDAPDTAAIEETGKSCYLKFTANQPSLSQYDAKTKCQEFVDSNFGEEDSAVNLSSYTVMGENLPKDSQALDFSASPSLLHQDANASHISLRKKTQGVGKILDETETTPFLPKSRQLPRTPVAKRNGKDLGEVQPVDSKRGKKSAKVVKKKKLICERKKELDFPEESDPILKKTSKQASKWKGCQWRRELEYAAKATACPWAETFEKTVRSTGPYASPEAAEAEMKKAMDDLFGNSWKSKEEAMLNVIRVARHHPEVVQENTTKIVVALGNEIKNFRQSVAGKAVLTAGHLYEIMGKTFENKLRIVVGALLGKSGNRTLAAYFRLVIQSLVKITSSTTPHKAALALIQEGSKHANKAARETAAQFLTLLTEQMGAEHSLAASHAAPMLKCAATFVADSSALTRYCGKRMFKVFLKHPDFDKLKDHQLDINTAQNLSKTLDQIKVKGITEEILPISIIY